MRVESQSGISRVKDQKTHLEKNFLGAGASWGRGEKGKQLAVEGCSGHPMFSLGQRGLSH